MSNNRINEILIAVLAMAFGSLFTLMITNDEVKSGIEASYFRGQLDALNGDIRIKEVYNKQYEWVKTPWEDGREPIFNPEHMEVTK